MFPVKRSDRQDTNSGLGRVDGKNSSTLQRLAVCLQRGHDERAKRLWRHVLHTSLNNARLTILRVREENAKVEIVGENDASMIAVPTA